MELKIDDKPLSFQDAAKVYKRICLSVGDKCMDCPLRLSKNGTNKPCNDFMLDHPDIAEPILKEWLAEHPIKTNRDKLIEVFGEIQKYDDKCNNHCSTIPCKSCNWWQQEYVEPFEGKE